MYVYVYKRREFGILKGGRNLSWRGIVIFHFFPYNFHVGLSIVSSSAVLKLISSMEKKNLETKQSRW